MEKLDKKSERILKRIIAGENKFEGDEAGIVLEFFDKKLATGFNLSSGDWGYRVEHVKPLIEGRAYFTNKKSDSKRYWITTGVALLAIAVSIAALVVACVK